MYSVAGECITENSVDGFKLFPFVTTVKGHT